MSLTVNQLANALSKTSSETVNLLKHHGINIVDDNASISEEDLRKLNNAMQQEKAQGTVIKEKNKLDEQASNSLEYYFNNYKIFIDTCSLLDNASDQFWINAVPLIQKTGNKVIIPLRVMDEVNKHCSNQNKPDLVQKANDTLKTLNNLINAQLVEIRGEKSDNFADNVFQVVFTKFRMTHKLLLITQDNNLASDILNLNNIKSVKAYPVVAKRINKYGFLSNNNSPRKEKLQQNTNHLKKKQSEDIDDEKFALSKSITTVPDVPLSVSVIPKEGDSVLAESGGNKKTIQLINTVASGGEGTIYTTSTPYVAKIYKAEKIDERKYEKIKLMLSKNIHCDGICYPLACLYNEFNEFVGYLMPVAKGKELQRSLFIKPLLLKNFPEWKKRDTVELCVTILEKIKYLHDRNIIMGDINPANILVVSPKEVYFVDTDSYQIEGFPCPVGTINYTAPEIQRKSFESFLRTLGNEYFAVATLLFMIMLPGKPPYSQQGGESPIDNILKMDFSYPFGEQSNKKTPDGPWRFIWSHLPYDIKEAFYQTFRKEGENSTEKDRLTIDEWIPKFKYYLQLLDSGRFGLQDKMSEDLFPTRYKKNPKVTYVKCNLCDNEVSEESCKNGICKECLNTGEVYKCSRCGKEILFTNYQRYIKNSKKHEICTECFEHGSSLYNTYRCIDCGRSYEITNYQYEFFRSKGYDIPKRCETCRKNKHSYSTPYARTSYSAPPIRTNNTSSNSSSKSNRSSSSRRNSLCFITTAVCDYFQKPDDCYELTALRDFRDGWLSLQPDGNTLISQYYAIAPDIVVQLSNSPLKDAIYHNLWSEYIKPCIHYIENKEYMLCKERYISMVNHLKQIFT